MKIYQNKLFLRFSLLFMVALASVYLVLYKVNSNYGLQVENLEADLVFETIQSGPLEYARSYSTVIANNHLERIVSSRDFINLGLMGAAIYGGPQFSDRISFFESPQMKALDEGCNSVKEKIVQEKSDYFPLRLVLNINSCQSSSLTTKLQNATKLTLSLAFVIVLICSTYFFRPILKSIELAEKALTTFPGEDSINKIWYPPIKQLAQKALEARKLEKYKLLHKVSKQVAHDIRSPLSAIEIISKSISDISGDKAELLKLSVARINAIANDLLDQSRTESALITIENENTEEAYLVPKSILDSAEIVSSISSIVKTKELMFASSGIKILFYNNLASDFKICCDKDVLERVLSNLINNSRDAIDNQGLITLDLSYDNGQLLIEVRDTGKGMPKEIIGDVFKEGVSFDKKDGNGLGLPHAKSSIESWGGTVRLSSTVGRGTVVSISLLMVT